MTPAKCKIYQIFYNQYTKNSNDEGFLGLDNLKNPRPDWFEYWPIREYLLNNSLDSDTYYGFFSPKFTQKTKLTSFDVINFINASKADIISFSPYFDQSAFPINIYEQAAFNHPKFLECVESTFKEIQIEIDLNKCVMDSNNSIFCNYFVAKKHVWEKWLDTCEKIFALSEIANTNAGILLNQPIEHDNRLAHLKIFIIERIISSLAYINSDWKIINFNPLQLPLTSSRISNHIEKLILMDSLKIAYTQHKNSCYIDIYNSIKINLIKQISELNINTH